MFSSDSIGESKGVETNAHPDGSPFTLKRLGFAIALIVGIGGLAVVGVGLGGYLQAGSLSHLGRVHSIIMMAVGGGGMISSIPVVVGAVKNHRRGGGIEPIGQSPSLTISNIKQNNPQDPPPTDNREMDPLAVQAMGEVQTDISGSPSPSWRTWRVISLQLSAQFSGGSDGWISPDEDKLSDLFLACDKDPDLLFASHPLAIERIKEERLAFVQILRDAFATGKKMVFILLDTGLHCLAAGFCADGTFKIIDSMYDNNIHVEALKKTLNQAKMRDAQGKPIHFEGEYINTHIQRGGNKCILFATLYCYHMGKEKKLTAFEEVNGAFLEGRLLRFEDYNKISGARKIRSLKGKNHDYESFMSSWSYRTQGLTVDTWEELSLQQIFNLRPFDGFLWTGVEDDFRFCHLYKSKRLPMFLSAVVQGCGPIIKETSGQQKEITHANLDTLLKPIPLPNLDAPIGELLHDQNEYLLVFKNDPKVPYLYQLRSDQKIVKLKKTLADAKSS